MKKLLILNLSAIILGFLFFLNIDRLLAHSWNWAPVFGFLPVAAGALAALLQDEDKSYKYLPKILASSCVFSLATIFLVKLFVYFGDSVNAPILQYFNPFKDKDEILGHFGLAGIYFFGGLIGIAIRGVNLIFFEKQKFKINLKISFIKSFLLGSAFLLAANIYYVFISIPPDGRWKFEMPITSIFVAVYLLLFFGLGKKLIAKSEHNYLAWAYNLFLSLIFLANAEAVRVFFQNDFALYFKYIAVAPYVVILGLGLFGFIILSFIFTKPEKKTIYILLAIIMVIILAVPLVFCNKMKELYIKNEIRKANYCRLDSDCQDAFASIGGRCPFGCYAYVNKSEVEKIKYMAGSFNSTCVYSCIFCPAAKCDNGQCVPVCNN